MKNHVLTVLLHICFSAAELQYYTSLYSLAIQFPCLLFLINWAKLYNTLMVTEGVATPAPVATEYILKMALLYIFNGIFFHFISSLFPFI